MAAVAAAGREAARAAQAAAAQLVEFINRSPSPWHAVDECRKRLLAAGFVELREADPWNIRPSEKYFVTRNQSTLVAFAVGGRFVPGNGFSIIGAHTDSPCIRVKPVSKKESHGYIQVGVELYGGGIWHTWFDRDLTLAGRVMVKGAGGLESRLVNVGRPILRVPSLAIHLNREVNEKFAPNQEKEIVPVLATAFFEQLQKTDAPQQKQQADGAGKHHPLLLGLLAEQLHVDTASIMDFELCLADTQPATIGGMLEEFVFAPRLDNLFNTYCATQALIDSLSGLEQDTNVRMVSLFDHEEVGSASAQGADSALQSLILSRICSTDGNPTAAYAQSIAKSLLVSADQAHSVHPNYADKHEENHRVQPHKGIVVKFNCKQRYATSALTAAILRELARRAGVPLQDFVVRNDSACGSTIGPLLASQLSVRTVDVGGPMLSMHSIREQCCVTSVCHALRLFEEFYRSYPEVYATGKYEY